MTPLVSVHIVSFLHGRKIGRRLTALPQPLPVRSIPCLAAPAATLLVLLDDKDTFLSEQDDVFVAEHASGAVSADGCPAEVPHALRKH